MSALSWIIGIALFLVAIIMVIGLVGITPVVYGKKSYDSLNKHQKDAAKVYVVVMWICIAISVISALYVLFTGGRVEDALVAARGPLVGSVADVIPGEYFF
jgi:hypothetical protein